MQVPQKLISGSLVLLGAATVFWAASAIYNWSQRCERNPDFAVIVEQRNRAAEAIKQGNHDVAEDLLRISWEQSYQQVAIVREHQKNPGLDERWRDFGAALTFYKQDKSRPGLLQMLSVLDLELQDYRTFTGCH
jgi:hypothetical protein